MNNFLKESAKHSLVLEWQLMYQNPFSGFLRVQGGHEQCFFFSHFCDVAELAIIHKTFNPSLAIHKI
jgi:hypothetical protein